MSDPKSFEIINPPNLLRAKVGRKLWKPDSDFLAGAEAALTELESEFTAWLEEDISKLVAARDAYYDGPSADSFMTLLCTVHDLKGLGVTYSYPLITRFAGALQLYLDEFERKGRPNRKIVDAHVEAIRSTFAYNLKDEKDELAQAVLKELHAALIQAKQEHSRK